MQNMNNEKHLLAQTPKMSFLEKFGFAAFSTSNNICFQFKSLYYMFFLTNVLGIGIATAGTVFAIGTEWDAVNDPLIGYSALNHKFKNGEKIRPYILVSIPWAVSIVMLFTPFQAPRRSVPPLPGQAADDAPGAGSGLPLPAGVLNLAE